VRRTSDAGAPAVVLEQGPKGQPLTPEAEPNDELAAPQKLPLPGGAKGTIGAGADKDHYAFDVAAPGVLAVSLTGGGEADLVVEIFDGAGKKLVASDNGKGGTLEGVPNLTVQPGVYTIAVREFVKKKKKSDKAPPPRAEASAPYALELVLGPASTPEEEVEPENGEAAFARVAAVDADVTGYIGWRNDRDVWKVPLEPVGDDDALAVDVDGVAGVALRVAILDGTESVLLERVGKAGEGLQLRNVAVRKEEPHYYVAVSGKTANLAEKYTLHIATAPFQLDEESEPNDKPASAGALSEVPDADSGTRVGFLNAGDADVFRLEPAAAPRLLQLTVEPPSSVDVMLSVVDDSGAPVAGSADAGKKGAVEKLVNVPVPADKPVFVKLTLKSGGSATERYRLRWSALPGEELAPIPGMEDE
jgi:hypothetical protein